MSHTGCCVTTCHKTGGHKFPNDPDVRNQWIKAIKRKQWTPTRHSVVCKAHFTEDDFVSHTVYGKYFLDIVIPFHKVNNRLHFLK